MGDSTQEDSAEGSQAYLSFLVDPHEEERRKRPRQEEAIQSEPQASAGISQAQETTEQQTITDLNQQLIAAQTQNKYLLEQLRERNVQLQRYSNIEDDLRQKVMERAKTYIRTFIKFSATESAMVRPEAPECAICKSIPEARYTSKHCKTMVCGWGLEQSSEKGITQHINDNGGRISVGCNAIICQSCWKQHVRTNGKKCPLCREDKIVELEPYTTRRRCLNCPFASDSSEDLLKHVFECESEMSWKNIIKPFNIQELYELAEGTSAGNSIEDLVLQAMGITKPSQTLKGNAGYPHMLHNIVGNAEQFNRTFEMDQKRMQIAMEILDDMLLFDPTKHIRSIMMLLFHCDMPWNLLSPLGLAWGSLKIEHVLEHQPFNGTIDDHEVYPIIQNILSDMKFNHFSEVQNKFVRTFGMFYIECERYLLPFKVTWARSAVLFSRYIMWLIKNIHEPPSQEWNPQNTTHALFKFTLQKFIQSGKMLENEIVGWDRVDALIGALDQGRAPYCNAGGAVEIESDDDDEY